ncbi:MAG TPA: CDGSH iron-sulfur domain-containing protein [Longimicrobiaceae bacterium]|nr:CDGSH iron-sulfur domain-containing protein [Longimicrobiaceae bacterium]
MAETIIIPQENGSYHVKGDFRVVLSDGSELEVEGGETWLCRCGNSSTKPFCDGTHKKSGFRCDNAEMLARP